MREVFQSSHHYCGHPLDPIGSMSSLYWGLQSWTQDSRWGLTRAEQNHLPWLAGHAAFDVAQHTIGLLGCEHTLLGHVELLVNQHSQVLLGRAAFNLFSAQPLFLLGIALAHVQDLAFSPVELCEVHMGPTLKPVQVPLDGIPSFQGVDGATQLDVIGKLAEGTLYSTVHVTNKDVKQHLSQYWPQETPLITDLHFKTMPVKNYCCMCGKGPHSGLLFCYIPSCFVGSEVGSTDKI